MQHLCRSIFALFVGLAFFGSVAIPAWAHDGDDKNESGCHLDQQRYHCHLVAWLEIYGIRALSAPENSENTANCTDFPSQKEAQEFFEVHNPAQDPHLLDRDKDFLACESRPSPQSKIMRQAVIEGWVN